MREKENKPTSNKAIKFTLYAIAILLVLFAFGCAGYAEAKQVELQREIYGKPPTAHVFIKDKSALWNLGFLAIIPATAIAIKGAQINERDMEEN